LQTVIYLVNHGANINHRDIRGNTALDDAKREHREEVVKYLEALEAKSESRALSIR
jgi:ankyrin repeat protein